MTRRYPRNALGYTTLVALLACGAASAQTTFAPPPNSAAPPGMLYNGAPPPPVPFDAGRNREQGVVLLKVLVAADGAARKVDIDADSKASPELTKAASDAALKWHYDPKLESGKAVESWLKVPVFFSLSTRPPHPPGPPHGGDMPPPPPWGGPMPPPPPPGAWPSSFNS